MIGLTDFITEGSWKMYSFIGTSWDDAYKEPEQLPVPIRRRGLEPQFTDSEVITVGLIIDTFLEAMKPNALLGVYRPQPTGLLSCFPSSTR
jgi:hypothetical protein